MKPFPDLQQVLAAQQTQVHTVKLKTQLAQTEGSLVRQLEIRVKKWVCLLPPKEVAPIEVF